MHLISYYHLLKDYNNNNNKNEMEKINPRYAEEITANGQQKCIILPDVVLID